MAIVKTSVRIGHGLYLFLFLFSSFPLTRCSTSKFELRQNHRRNGFDLLDTAVCLFGLSSSEDAVEDFS
jgi:hypothetical protein